MPQPGIFTDFAPRHAALWGHHPVNLGHALADTDLFSDDSLAHLIERAPPRSYHVNTMDVTSHDPRTRREGTILGLSGRQTLAALRKGHIWILLQNPDQLDTRFQHMLRDIYAELHDRVPGFRSYRHKLSLLISSPNVQVYYHADVPGQTLWQVRGNKKVFVYPSSPPFLPREGLERIVMGEAHEISLPYEPWFDDYAQVFDIGPGRMLHWPLNGPHRVVNGDCLNVSFTTEHWTDDLRNAYAVNYANGLLRARLGLQHLGQPQSGPGLWARLGLTAAWKASGLARKRRQRFRVEFEVDPAAPLGVRSIPAYDLAK